jgi:hypothetical protein
LTQFGFGRYEFWVSGPNDKLDPNVVFGLFSYPTADIGADGTNEIDIEFARWGNPQTPIGNYTVWPVRRGLQRAHKSVSVELSGVSRQSFVRSRTSVKFQSLPGYAGDSNQSVGWSYQPSDPADLISQASMPIHMNLWLYNGRPPADGREVELTIEAFRFIPQ